MEPKAAASLTAGLLARKGLARPAMRRQGVVGVGPRAVPLDDLGWNDMGEDVEASAPATPPVPSPVAQHIAAIQETLNRREEERSQAIQAEAKPPAAPRLTPPAPRKAKPKAEARPKAVAAKAPVATATAPAPNRKSAFTLRIDGERHLRLRLLSAVTNQSAQNLLIGALDALIAQHPNIDALAADPKVRPDMAD